MKKRTNQEVREASGNIDSSDNLVKLLYTLMRDEITPGRMEGVLDRIASDARGQYTNGWLADYAKNIAAWIREENLS